MGTLIKDVSKACVSLIVWRMAKAIRQTVYEHSPEIVSNTICKQRVFGRRS